MTKIGTLIVYPIGDWYGQVTAKGDSVAKLVAEVNDGNEGCFDKCHRGRAKLVSW